jgi:signal transduction histidine kinase/ActR/RegA family two-component response regulator
VDALSAPHSAWNCDSVNHKPHAVSVMSVNSSPAVVRVPRDSRNREIHAAQVRLLYGNGNVGVVVTVVAATVLGRLQWRVIPHAVVLGWWLCMFLVAAARFTLGWRYRRVAPLSLEAGVWGTAFTIGAGLAGVAWGAAGVLLNPEDHLENQVFLAFILGGMMLGAAPLLAPLPKAFLAFMLPTGVAPAVRFIVQGDEAHLAMGLLAGLFVAATLITTRRIHLTIVSSLNLRFENQDLVDDLQAAKSHAEALNEQLEVRVQERTAELQQSTQHLKTVISQREQMEEELLRARKLESLGVLAGGIAHDFNNFLAVVQGNVELAMMQLGRNRPVRAILEKTQSACQRAAMLSSQLLTFAKGGQPVRQVVSVAKLVTDAVDLVRAGAQTSIELNISEDLKSAEVDPGQIVQVLHNILLNARHSMPDAGIIEVHAENILIAGAQGADNRVRISIRDFGCGIPADVMPRIFDPYFTTKPSGRGLGLATAYAIIAKHGGSLSVESKPGHGTVFTIDLPASLAIPAPQVPAVSEILPGTERILVMDDEEGLRVLLKTLLRSLGYEVETARDGAEAIALCEDAIVCGKSFDAVLLDLTVNGGMGGLETVSRLKEIDPSVRLIVSSGYSDATVMSNFRKYGFDDVLPKPWRITEVSQVLRRVLARAQDRKAQSGS